MRVALMAVQDELPKHIASVIERGRKS
jgi:hypothetical protein